MQSRILSAVFKRTMAQSQKTAHDEFLKAQFASLPPLPAVERLSPSIIRILGGNPGVFKLQGTNTYLLGTGPSRILIDTAEGFPAWITSLTSVLTSEKATISTCLLTHWHHDHVGGISDLRTLSPETTFHKHSPDDGQLPIEDGQEFKVEGATLKALFTPGHTSDHMSFLLHEENSIFTGDTVLGHGTTVFENLTTYMKSLEAMQAECPALAYPAHGAVVGDAKKKLSEYVRHRNLRENQIVTVLEKKHEADRLTAVWGGSQGVTSMEVVKTIYRDVGVGLHAAAEKGTVQVLEKLESEGKVGTEEKDGVVRWFLRESPWLKL